MANTFISPNWVTTDTATGFLDSTKLIGRFDRQWDDSFFNKPGGAQIGDTVQVRIEQRWLATEGQALQQQAILNQTVPITVNHQFNVGMGWSTAQATLEVEEVQGRYTRPAGKRLAAKWDRVAGAEVYKSVYFSVGTPGTNISTNATWQDAVAMLQEQAVPDEYYACMSPSQQATLTSSNQAFFNPAAFIGEMFKSGKFGGAALGMREWYFDPLLPMHTTGTYTASTWVTATTAGQTGSTLTVSGAGTYSLKRVLRRWRLLHQPARAGSQHGPFAAVYAVGGSGWLEHGDVGVLAGHHHVWRAAERDGGAGVGRGDYLPRCNERRVRHAGDHEQPSESHLPPERVCVRDGGSRSGSAGCGFGLHLGQGNAGQDALGTSVERPDGPEVEPH